MSENKIKGDFGEETAKIFLKKKNVIILEKNFRTRSGEIDIIGLFNNLLIFYEVKTRKGNLYGSPAEAVTRSKINKIKLTSKFYMAKFNLYNYDIRYDVIEVFLNKDEKVEKINIIENAFWVSINLKSLSKFIYKSSNTFFNKPIYRNVMALPALYYII